MDLKNYTYELPAHRIAESPLDQRDQSKLLIYKNGKIDHANFSDICGQFGEDDSVFFNNTRVIPARLHFQRETGAHIEVFLLEPALPSSEVASAMTVRGEAVWKCMVGNFKKWKDHEELLLDLEGSQVQATIFDRSESLIQFKWSDALEFSGLLELIGKIPLPPYIKREVTAADEERYQTVYNQAAGAVAAPTAGLHFTENILAKFTAQGVKTDFLTLHVSAGTFLPIKDVDVLNHEMHAEQIYVTRENIEHILQAKRITAVGTTSMRTLESLYWYGVKLSESSDFSIDQRYPYSKDPKRLPTRNTAIQNILDMMIDRNLSAIHGETSIFIYPGYTFRMCDRLITNFHLPGSTLILLVAAFIGEDWRKVYKSALDNDYRFLSYGDSSLLIPG